MVKGLENIGACGGQSPAFAPTGGASHAGTAQSESASGSVDWRLVGSQAQGGSPPAPATTSPHGAVARLRAIFEQSRCRPPPRFDAPCSRGHVAWAAEIHPCSHPSLPNPRLKLRLRWQFNCCLHGMGGQPALAMGYEQHQQQQRQWWRWIMARVCCSGAMPEENPTLQRQRTIEWLTAMSRQPSGMCPDGDGGGSGGGSGGRRASMDQQRLPSQAVGPWGPVLTRRRPSCFGGRCAPQSSHAVRHRRSDSVPHDHDYITCSITNFVGNVRWPSCDAMRLSLLQRLLVRQPAASQRHAVHCACPQHASSAEAGRTDPTHPVRCIVQLAAFATARPQPRCPVTAVCHQWATSAVPLTGLSAEMALDIGMPELCHPDCRAYPYLSGSPTDRGGGEQLLVLESNAPDPPPGAPEAAGGEVRLAAHHITHTTHRSSPSRQLFSPWRMRLHAAALELLWQGGSCGGCCTDFVRRYQNRRGLLDCGRGPVQRGGVGRCWQRQQQRGRQQPAPLR